MAATLVLSMGALLLMGSALADTLLRQACAAATAAA